MELTSRSGAAQGGAGQTGRRSGSRSGASWSERPRSFSEEVTVQRFNVENRSLLLDAETLDELGAVVETQTRYYNQERRHSSRGNRPPYAVHLARS